MSEFNETKKCKHCQSDIPKKANVCPVCRKKQKKSILGIILIVLGVFVLIGALSGQDNDSVKKVETPEKTTKNEETKNVIKNVFKVGETAEYKDIQVSLLSYKETNGNDWGKPDNGNIFVYAEFEIVNNSKEEISLSSMMTFENYCDDYKLDYSSNAFLAMSTETEIHQLDGSIAPGKKMKGLLGLEVPTDWKNIEIYYKDNVWLDSNFSFVIEK